MKVLINERLSQHKYKTPEGYLICQDAILARTGKQTYTRGDVFGQDTRDADSDIEIDRKYEEVFSPKTLASFENKPVTVEHPDEDVNVDNYKEYAVGFVRDVKQGKTENGEDVILGTLVITDAQTIKEIEDGEHTELSCGYDCDIIDEENPQQRNIRGNHVALCEHGRAGIAKIVDSEKIKDSMMYKGYKLEEAKYLHNEEIGAKIAITKNGIIVGGADSYEEAKAKIDNMKSEKDLHYSKDSFDDSIKDIHRIYLYYLVSAGGAHVDNRGRLRYDGGEDSYKLYESIEEARKDLDEYQRKLGVKLYIEKDIFLDDSIKDVNPREDESKDEFISRFMSETKSEYPDEKQRLAVANSYWERKGRDSIKDSVFYAIRNNYGDVGIYESLDRAKLAKKGDMFKHGADIYQVNRNIKEYYLELEMGGQGDLRDKLYFDIKKGIAKKIDDSIDDSIDDTSEKNYKIYVKNNFGAYKVCDWPAVSKEAAVKEFLESNPAYKNKGIIEARDSIKDGNLRTKRLKVGQIVHLDPSRAWNGKVIDDDFKIIGFYYKDKLINEDIAPENMMSFAGLQIQSLKTGKKYDVNRFQLMDSINDEDKYIVWADRTKQGNRALYRTATGNAQYCYGADAHKFTKDEAIKLTNQKGGKYTWVMKKVGDSVNDEYVAYIKQSDRDYGTIVERNGIFYTSAEPGQKFGNLQSALSYSKQKGWNQISKEEWDKFTNKASRKGEYDSLKKYEISYKDSKGDTYIHIVKANSLEDAISKIKDDEIMYIGTSTRGNEVKIFSSVDARYKHSEQNTGWQYWKVPKNEFKSLAKQRNPWFAFTRLNNENKITQG